MGEGLLILFSSYLTLYCMHHIEERQNTNTPKTSLPSLHVAKKNMGSAHQISTINVREYESKLKEPMECFRCRRQEGNDVPKMKKHLEREFEEEVLEKGRERGGEIERTCRED